MNDKEKQDYLEKYHEAKEKGVPFFPDIIFKDTVVILLVFLILVALAYFVGAPLEDRANPADSNYTPRPEWYFLFLFQLLKYFPGQLEVLGVVLLPTLAILILFLLPFLDRSPKRYFMKRPVINTITFLGLAGIVFLTVQSVRETPPPASAASGDEIAVLYTKNCAACHGPTITVPAGTNLHNVIAQGKHEGMPAWSADLTSDQIDALAGFILAPGGSALYQANCGKCHPVTQLVASDPLKLKTAIGKGSAFEPHKDQVVPDWSKTLTAEQQTQLLNFLGAPDGQRLFAINCSPCHGKYVAVQGDKDQLKKLISEGGLHKDMPPWREKLSDTNIKLLAQYVVDPTSTKDGEQLFQTNCIACHGQRIPKVDTVDNAYKMIANGGSHQTMPIWGKVLTSEQLDALVNYTFEAKNGSTAEVGQQLFERNCSGCHGQYGEGGPNPSRKNSIISPISTSEFLKTRDDATLAAIITQGQPDLGMSSFGSTAGGPLSDEDINAIIGFMRSWETNPPVVSPPEIPSQTLALKGGEIYQNICAQCHGTEGEGSVGPALSDPTFQKNASDQAIYDVISRGQHGTSMIAWGNILTADQINQIIAFIRLMKPKAGTGSAAPTFADVEAIFKTSCAVCHGKYGGWDSSSYDKVMTSGDHAPVVIPGDPGASLLAQKLLGTSTEGTVMPPDGKLPDLTINIILNWIKSGAVK